VRFTTYDGRRLEANLPIEVQTAGSATSVQDWKKAKTSIPEEPTASAADAGDGSIASDSRSKVSKRSIYESNDSADTSTNPSDTARDVSRRAGWSPYR
jgi:hypothetical protein